MRVFSLVSFLILLSSCVDAQIIQQQVPPHLQNAQPHQSDSLQNQPSNVHPIEQDNNHPQKALSPKDQQDAAPSLHLNGVPSQEMLHQPPVMQQPPAQRQPNNIPHSHESQSPNVVSSQQHQVPRQQPTVLQSNTLQHQQPNLPPVQQGPVQTSNVQKSNSQQVSLQQQPPMQELPDAMQQIPLAQRNAVPPHMHNEQPIIGYEHHSHESLPPKPRHKTFDPPIVIQHDSELDFYSRLPSQNAGYGMINNVDSIRPFVSLTVNVTPAIKDCYFYEALTGFDVDVQVLGGDGMDIGLSVFDPSGAPVVVRDPAPEASVSISVIPQYQGKAYAVCLDNRKASYGRKKVFLAIDLHINWDDPSLAEKAAIERMKMGFKNSAENAEMRKFFDNFDRLADTLDRISGLLHRTQRLQQRSRNTAAMDRAMMQANKDRVNSWSTFQVVLLVFVGFIQTRLIRSLFDEQSSLYRLWVHGSGSVRSTQVSGLRL